MNNAFTTIAQALLGAALLLSIGCGDASLKGETRDSDKRSTSQPETLPVTEPAGATTDASADATKKDADAAATPETKTDDKDKTDQEAECAFWGDDPDFAKIMDMLTSGAITGGDKTKVNGHIDDKGTSIDFEIDGDSGFGAGGLSNTDLFSIAKSCAFASSAGGGSAHAASEATATSGAQP